ncbi:MAG: GxxExxY protein [Luteolibacter sp.]
MFEEASHPHSELTGRIIACAQAVHQALRPGLDERVYENALCIEFAERGVFFEQQCEFPVFYRERIVGKLIPDLLVERTVIVDLKVVESFNDAHIAQILGYLNITGMQVGLLLNFKHATIQVKRIAALKSHRSSSSTQ